MAQLGSTGNLNIFTRGNKLFELSNHLGNVLVTLSDKKKGIQSGTTGTVLYYLPMLKSAQDYYPFGMMMPGRKYNAASLYRYGFNGKENDNEVKGEGNQQDYGMRIYDPRLGRFLSVDPITGEYPELTPYQFSSNNPIWMIDLDGLEGVQYPSPRAYLVEGFRQYFTAAGNLIDKVTPSFSFGRKTNVEMEAKGKATIGTNKTEFSITGVLSSTEKKLTYNGVTPFFQFGAPLMTFSSTTEQFQTTEVKLSQDAVIRGVPVNATIKISDNKTKGKTYKVEAGPQVEEKIGNNLKGKVYTKAFYEYTPNTSTHKTGVTVGADFEASKDVFKVKLPLVEANVSLKTKTSLTFDTYYLFRPWETWKPR